MNRIYQPHIGEVFPLMQSLRKKHIMVSGLPQRALKAEQILLNGGVCWSNGWHVTSQANQSIAYRVNGKCECRDSGVYLDDKKFCKHRLATTGYQIILDKHLNSLTGFLNVEKEFDAMWTGHKYTFPTEQSIFNFSQWLELDGGRQSLPASNIPVEVREYTMFEHMLDELSEQRLHERAEEYDGVNGWRF